MTVYLTPGVYWPTDPDEEQPVTPEEELKSFLDKTAKLMRSMPTKDQMKMLKEMKEIKSSIGDGVDLAESSSSSSSSSSVMSTPSSPEEFPGLGDVVVFPQPQDLPMSRADLMGEIRRNCSYSREYVDSLVNEIYRLGRVDMKREVLRVTADIIPPDSSGVAGYISAVWKAVTDLDAGSSGPEPEREVMVLEFGGPRVRSLDI